MVPDGECLFGFDTAEGGKQEIPCRKTEGKKKEKKLVRGLFFADDAFFCTLESIPLFPGPALAHVASV